MLVVILIFLTTRSFCLGVIVLTLLIIVVVWHFSIPIILESNYFRIKSFWNPIILESNHFGIQSFWNPIILESNHFGIHLFWNTQILPNNLEYFIIKSEKGMTFCIISCHFPSFCNFCFNPICLKKFQIFWNNSKG